MGDKGGRKAMLNQLLEQNSHSLTKNQVGYLVDMMEGYSCSDLRGIGREAAFGPLRELEDDHSNFGDMKEKELRPISYSDFKHAIEICAKSVSQSFLNRFKEWENEQN